MANGLLFVPGEKPEQVNGEVKKGIRDLPATERPAHGRSSPSSLHRRAACPGSLRMEMLAPPDADESSLAAERGTMLHAVMAEGLDNTDVDLLSDWDAFCVSYCAKRVAEFRKRIEPPFIVLREHEVDLRWLHPDISHGVLDLAFVQPMHYAILFDFKFGYTDVEPVASNLQLHAYAAGIMDEYEIQPENCLLVIMQPAKGLCESSPVQRPLAESIIHIASNARNPKAKLNPTLHGCRFCRAAAVCPELAKSVDVLAELNSKPVEQMTHAEMSAALVKGELATVFLKAAKARAYAILSAGGQLEGWKLGEGKSSREWTDDALEQLKKVSAAIGKSPYSILKTELLSPAQLEKAWGKSKPVVEAITPLIIKKSGAPVLERA